MKKTVFLFVLLIVTFLSGCVLHNAPPGPQQEEYVAIPTEEEPIVGEEFSKTSAAPTEEEPEEQTPEEEPVEEQPATQEPEEKAYVRSKVNSLILRSAPDLSSTRLGCLDVGDMVAFCGREGNWYRTFYRGREAYVSANEVYTEKVNMERAVEPIETVISLGEKLLGTPYVYGAVRLHDGYGNKLKSFSVDEFDCSSYMQYIFYYGADVVLRSTTRTQVEQGKTVKKTDLQRGDLIFMTNSSRRDRTGIERIGHVAMYLGDDYILHTASDHAVIEKMTTSRWNNYITARRMI